MARKDGQPDGRGGKRDGAGRKKSTRTFSDRLKKEVQSGLRKVAKEKGMTFGEYLARQAQDDDSPHLARASFSKIIASILVVTESHKTVETQTTGVVHIPAEDTPEETASVLTIQ